jgi:hypothetical protein
LLLFTHLITPSPNRFIRLGPGEAVSHGAGGDDFGFPSLQLANASAASFGKTSWNGTTENYIL